MEERKLNVSYSKSGSGSITSRLAIPIVDLRKMGVTPENRNVTYIFDEKNKQIIIRKTK